MIINKFEKEVDENKKDAINRRNMQGPKYLKFFLLVYGGPSPKPKPMKPKPNKRPKPKGSLGAWLEHWEKSIK